MVPSYCSPRCCPARKGQRHEQVAEQQIVDCRAGRCWTSQIGEWGIDALSGTPVVLDPRHVAIELDEGGHWIACLPDPFQDHLVF